MTTGSSRARRPARPSPRARASSRRPQPACDSPAGWGPIAPRRALYLNPSISLGGTMKRALWASGLSVVVLAAGGALFVQGGSGGPENTSALGADAASPPAVTPPDAKSADPSTNALGADAAGPPPAAPPAAKPADPPPVADGPKPGGFSKKADAERAQLLETVGCLTAAHYFQTYLNIGF